MKSASFLLSLLFVSGSVSAQEGAWLVQSDMTPETLSSNGAQLTSTDSMVWPDGNSVLVTYWRGDSDAIFRCAEIRDGEALNPSCWRQEVIVNVPNNFVAPVVRRISTQSRPPAYVYQQPCSWNPGVWLDVHR